MRWYSPRDWVEHEEKVIDAETNQEKIVKKYDLSARMKISDNVWVEVWKNAKPVTARRQKRLFDDTKEAENVFEWLNNLSIGQIVENILPILFHSSIHASYLESKRLNLEEFSDSCLELLVEKTIKLSRNNTTESGKKYQNLLVYFKSVEKLVSLMKSLSKKFALDKLRKDSSLEKETKFFLKEIVRNSIDNESCYVKVKNGARSNIGKLLSKLCNNNNKKSTTSRSKNKKRQAKQEDTSDNVDLSDDFEDDLDNENLLLEFRDPFRREYILRTSASRPAPYSRPSPQRLYCLVTDSEFRLAGAFTEDTMFF